MGACFASRRECFARRGTEVRVFAKVLPVPQRAGSVRACFYAGQELRPLPGFEFFIELIRFCGGYLFSVLKPADAGRFRNNYNVFFPISADVKGTGAVHRNMTNGVGSNDKNQLGIRFESRKIIINKLY